VRWTDVKRRANQPGSAQKLFLLSCCILIVGCVPLWKWGVFPLPIDVYADGTLTEAQRSALGVAVQAWNTALSMEALVIRDFNEIEGSDIPCGSVVFFWGAPDEGAYMTTRWDNLKSPCFAYVEIDDEKLTHDLPFQGQVLAFEHELGHVLGLLKHSDQQSEIMYGEVNKTQSITRADVDKVKKRHDL
jgi:hypothetical protein